jgi:hypothetical protein|tara:strand:+ start:1327 stop:1500 length:174 start_codon:yes stop_codon:yes gene_type:complete
MNHENNRLDEITEAMQIYRDKSSKYYEDSNRFKKQYDKAWDKYINIKTKEKEQLKLF